MTSWYASLQKDRPLAVVADARTPDIVTILQQLYCEWGKPFSVWLNHSNSAVASWATPLKVPLVHISEHPTISVRTPAMTTPLVLTGGVLQSVQLVFLASAVISREGLWLGGVYSLSYLVPQHSQPITQGEWNLLLLELYRRFHVWPVIVPLHNGTGWCMLSGASWAMDEMLMDVLPPRSDAFHAALRRLLLPPTVSPDQFTGSVPYARTDATAYPAGLTFRITYRVVMLPYERLAFVYKNILTVLVYRCRKYWRQLQGN